MRPGGCCQALAAAAVLSCALRPALAAGPAESADRQAAHAAVPAMPALERQVSTLEARVRRLRRQRRQRPPLRPPGEGAGGGSGSAARSGGGWLQEDDVQAALTAAEADAGDPALLAVAEALSEENKLLRRENVMYRRKESEHMNLLETETEFSPDFSKLDGIVYVLLFMAATAPCCYCACLVIKHEGIYTLGSVCCWCCVSMSQRSHEFWILLFQYMLIAVLAGRVLYLAGAIGKIREYLEYVFVAYMVIGLVFIFLYELYYTIRRFSDDAKERVADHLAPWRHFDDPDYKSPATPKTPASLGFQIPGIKRGGSPA